MLTIDSAVIAVDIPIGLPQLSGRKAEREVRTLVGTRRSSVFPVPSRVAIMCDEYDEARRLNLANSNPPRKVQKQFFCLSPKVREVDSLITPKLQELVFETHPELAFCMMNGRQPLKWPKKKAAGQDERRVLLAASGFPLDKVSVPHFRRADVAADDIIDACACAWVARRISTGMSIRVPADPQFDARGLRMEINA